MKNLERHLCSLTYAAGACVSYWIGPRPPLDFPLSAVMWLSAGTYVLALIFSYLTRADTLWRKIGQAAAIYLISFYAFWIAGSFALKLSSAPPLPAIAGMTVTFLIGAPIVLFKLVPAAAIAIALQYLIHFLRKRSI